MLTHVIKSIINPLVNKSTNMSEEDKIVPNSTRHNKIEYKSLKKQSNKRQANISAAKWIHNLVSVLMK